MRDVVIVGGGIAGMVAARDLAWGGLSVAILEASGTLGGKVTSHVVGGLVLDAGAESFATRRDTVATLARELGLGDRLVTPNPAGAWLQPARGAAHPLPSTGMLGIPGTPMARDVIAVVGLAAAFRAQLDSLLPGVVGSRERYLGPLVRKRMGRRVVDRLVAPVAAGIHSVHPDELLVDTVAPGLRSALRQQESLSHAVLALRSAAPAGTAVAGLAGGMHTLTAALEQELAALGVEVRLDSPVTQHDPDGVVSGGRVDARRVVLACPPQGGPTTPIVLVTLVIDDATLDAAPRGTGVLVAQGAQGITAKALTHATAKWGWLADAGGDHRHVLRLSYDGARLGSGDLAQLDLEQLAMADAESLLGVTLAASAVVGSSRVEWAVPVPAGPAAEDGVTRVGETVSGIGLAAVIDHARSTAARILGNFTGMADARGDD